ncbi:hypothetical protein GGX14DRAFT_556805 [Mycena pura]|uniref:Uncharacterized protein n=1 Tax=Mycena pura TaxID=153505 RepID=A0AAD6YQ85_9AGAR|nr:hypothetical protein GGX14DRAFT_556805 [Mycena pura]
MPRHEDASYPSFSLVISQAPLEAPTYLVSPWSQINYPSSTVQLPLSANPNLVPPSQAIQQPPNANAPRNAIRSIRHFFAHIVAKLKARLAT